MRNILITFVIFSVIFIMTACGGKSVNSSNWIELVQKDELNKEIQGYNEINIYTGVGDIEIKPSQDKSVSVHIIKKVKGDNENKKKELMESVEVSLSDDGQKLFLSAYPKNKRNEDLWKWKTKNFDSIDLEIDFIVEIPSNILFYNLNSGVGNVKVDNVAGAYKIKTGVGNAELNKISFIKKSIIETGTGSAKIDILKLENSEEVSVETGVGDVEVNIPSDLKYNLDTEAFMEKPKRETVNGGGTVIKIKSSMGRISVNGQ